MVRAPCYDKMGLKRGEWSREEDEKLIAYIRRYGIWNWREMPKPAGLSRTGKSCRLRWMNYLRPDIKHGNFSKKEEEIILKLHELLGNRWSAIAARLPGRTDNEIKNYWHTKLKKHVKDALAQRRTKPEVLDKGLNNEANQKKSCETNVLLLPFAMEASKLKGFRDIPAVSPQFSTGAFVLSSTDPIVAINEIEKASNFDATEKASKERVSETNLLLPIVMEASKLKGSRDNPAVSPQLSNTGTFASSSTDPIVAINEIEKATNSEANQLKKFCETNLLLPIVLESSKLKGSRDIPAVSPQLSTGDFSSSSSIDPSFAINEIDSMGQNIGSLETFGELQSLWAKKFSMESFLCKVEDHSTLADLAGHKASSSQMWIQQQMSPFGSLKTHEELQSFPADPFSGENFYIVEDHQATTFEDKSNLLIQEHKSPICSSEAFGELQTLWMEPFSMENLYLVKDQAWMQEQLSPFAYYKDGDFLGPFGSFPSYFHGGQAHTDRHSDLDSNAWLNHIDDF